MGLSFLIFLILCKLLVNTLQFRDHQFHQNNSSPKQVNWYLRREASLNPRTWTWFFFQTKTQLDFTDIDYSQLMFMRMCTWTVLDIGITMKYLVSPTSTWKVHCRPVLVLIRHLNLCYSANLYKKPRDCSLVSSHTQYRGEAASGDFLAISWLCWLSMSWLFSTTHVIILNSAADG